MVSFCLNLLINYLIQITNSSVKKPWGKTSWMTSDDVSNLARMNDLFSLRKWLEQFECFNDVVFFSAS